MIPKETISKSPAQTYPRDVQLTAAPIGGISQISEFKPLFVAGWKKWRFQKLLALIED